MAYSRRKILIIDLESSPGQARLKLICLFRRSDDNEIAPVLFHTYITYIVCKR